MANEDITAEAVPIADIPPLVPGSTLFILNKSYEIEDREPMPDAAVSANASEKTDMNATSQILEGSIILAKEKTHPKNPLANTCTAVRSSLWEFGDFLSLSAIRLPPKNATKMINPKLPKDIEAIISKINATIMPYGVRAFFL